MPPPDAVYPNTPLRLRFASEIAFPDGTMSDSGLRREVAQGRLEVETIAGKQYTTLAAIERMRELCRDRPRTNVVVPERAPGAANMSQAKIPSRGGPHELRRHFGTGLCAPPATAKNG